MPLNLSPTCTPSENQEEVACFDNFDGSMARRRTRGGTADPDRQDKCAKCPVCPATSTTTYPDRRDKCRV